MTALLEVEGLGRADHCEAYGAHRPQPNRFVWHHVLPQVCGGRTVAENLAQVCDTCHYGIHALMYALAQGRPLPTPTHRGQHTLALRGYDAAVAAGTVALIPNEGTAIS